MFAVSNTQWYDSYISVLFQQLEKYFQFCIKLFSFLVTSCQ